MFHKTGAMAEKESWVPLADEIHSIPVLLVLVGQADVIGESRSNNPCHNFHLSESINDYSGSFFSFFPKRFKHCC